MAITYLRYWGSHFKRPQNSYWLTGIMRRIVEAGWKPYLVCCRPPSDPSLMDEVLKTGTKIVYLPRPQGSFDIGCMRRAYELCKHLHCDIFHCDNMHTSPLIGAALARVPVRLWSKNSMNPAYEMMRRATFRERIALSIRISSWLATKILPMSIAIKNELMEMGIPSSKMIISLDPVEVKPMDRKIRCQAREEFGYKDDEIVFTTIGHAVPVKGWDILLRSFVRVVSEYPKSRLLFLGTLTASKEERDHYSILDSYICKKGIAHYVRFLGYKPDLEKVLAASDVFVLSSRSEGGCGAFLEAMTYGLPCVATKVGYATDYIENGMNGLLVERGSEGQLADAMISLAKNPKLRLQIASAVQARRKYAPTFLEHGDQLLEIYKNLLSVHHSKCVSVSQT